MIKLLMGYPASGKTTIAKQYVEQGYVHLNRDKNGGEVKDLIPKYKLLVETNKNIVLDNTFPSKISRQPFITIAKKAGVPIECVHVNTSIEDSQINFLLRTHKKYNKLFFTSEECNAVNDPNVFPIIVFFIYRKQFEKPSITEGFSKIETIPFKRKWGEEFVNKALILDYDDTLRTSKRG